jgi:hypothetical protein
MDEINKFIPLGLQINDTPAGVITEKIIPFLAMYFHELISGGKLNAYQKSSAR